MQSLIDRYLDNLEARLLALEQELAARTNGNGEVGIVEAANGTQEEQVLHTGASNKRGKSRERGGVADPEWHKRSDDPRAVVQGISETLRAEKDSAGYVKVKTMLSQSFSSLELATFIEIVRGARDNMGNWDRVASCILAAIKALPNHEHDSLKHLACRCGDSVCESVINHTADTRIASETRLLRKIIDALPSDAAEREIVIRQTAVLLAEHNSPTVRAAAVDLVALSFDDDLAKQVAVTGFLPDAHRLVEEAVRRLASSNDGTRTTIIGFILVDGLLKHRGEADLAYISRTAIKFNVEHLFENLTSRGEIERMRVMVKQGVNKALGMVTLKPERKYVAMAVLVEEGHHLTARRIARDRPIDDQILLEQFGLMIDDEAAERELAFRKETCLQLPLHIPVHWIANEVDLKEFSPRILSTKGTLTMDVEWQPDLKQRGLSPAQIVQIARDDAVYIFDVAPTSALRGEAFDKFMKTLLLSVDSVWGFGLEMDCKVLQRSFPTSSWCGLLRARSRNVSAVPAESLRGLCERVLGVTLDKEQQMSDWGRRPLYHEQLQYAATDAYALVVLKHALFLEGQESEVHHSLPASLSTLEAEISDVATATEEEDIAAQIGRHVKFFCDETLKRVAKMLRAVNVDCEYEQCGDRRSIALRSRLDRARRDGRIFITIDGNLRGMRGVYVLESKENEDRFYELVHRYSIPLDHSNILLRCTKCNGPGFEIISRDEARRLKPEAVTEYVYNNVAGEFYCCPLCTNVVWQGKKFREVQTRMERLIDTALSSNNNADA